MNRVFSTSYPKPTSQTTGPKTICTYRSGTSFVAIAFATGISKTLWAGLRAELKRGGDHDATVTGVGDAAYSYAAGAGAYPENSISVLKKSTDLVITSASASPAKVKAMAQVVVPTL